MNMLRCKALCAVLVGALPMALAAPVHAETFVAVAQLHDFDAGPQIIRDFFQAEFNGESRTPYQSGRCVGGNALYQSRDGVKDDKPIQVQEIMLLGEREQVSMRPVYLVRGIRTVWARDRHIELSCAWMVNFNGNSIHMVREAGELRYLFN
ncbi:hypothetical protein [Erythrobacter sp. Alg231-14]|uniref:hypothetical protein n=1 Tax=Erythrobacter sp. Alg231-14 TaxID=1922225 RepID=UPI000D55AA45